MPVVNIDMQMNQLVILTEREKSTCTSEKRNFTEGDIVVNQAICWLLLVCPKWKKKQKTGSFYQQRWTLPAEPFKKMKWVGYEVDIEKTCSCEPTKDWTHQWESGDNGARSPRWVSSFYNWRLPHQWCCSTEGSRHLYTPVGIRIIASHLELVAINWITSIIGS